MSRELSCGLEYSIVNDLATSVSETLFNSYSFIVFPVIHPRFKRNYCAGNSNVKAFTRSDMLLTPQEWTTRVVGKISSHLDVDVPSPIVRAQHEDCFTEELAYCRGLGLPAVMFNLRSEKTTNLARLLHTHFNSCQHSSIMWVRVPMICKKTQRENTNSTGEIVDEHAAFDKPWLWWTKFYERMEWDKRLGLVLEFTANLPNYAILERWFGEPIKAVVVPTSIFITNRKGYPTLPIAHQRVLLSMVEREAQIILSGAHRSNIQFYVNYFKNLYKKTYINTDDPMLKYAKGWEDFLQTPLQPLADNLDTHTYNIFEKDPVKYRQYQSAITQALQDVKLNDMIKNIGVIEINENNLNNLTKYNVDDEYDKVFTVMVLGAGRGPLVRATLNAADISRTKVKVIAVEKNPCAIVVLEGLVRELWQKRNVQVVAGDMRNIKLSPPADIIVSELLGSWGDNELSPECLDGAAGLLAPGGISIPKAYTSYAAPITSPRLWAAARSVCNKDGICETKNLETLWVVYMQNKYDIAEAKPIFTFEHPAKAVCDHEGNSQTDYRGLPLTDNRRQAVVTWTAAQDSVMHGFGGYFDCTLYGNEMISIVPSTHSPEMISWFPVFIPIKTPLRIKKGDNITATFWRCVSSRRVWYEWVVEVGDKITSIHNSNGKSSEMLL